MLTRLITNKLGFKPISTVLVGLMLTPLVLADTDIDTDMDGITDQLEIIHGLNPDQAYDVWRDEDGDHLPAIYELVSHMDNTQADNNLFEHPQLLAISAIADIHGQLTNSKQVKQLLDISQNPVEVYQYLLTDPIITQMDFIARAYQQLLQRSPDVDGGRYYQRQLSGSMTPTQMLAQMLHSKEFSKLHGPMDALQLEQWLIHSFSLSNSDSNKLTILQQATKALFAEQKAPQHSQYFIQMLSLLLINQLPDKQQLRLWQQALINDDLQSVLQGLLNTDAYRLSRLATATPASTDTDGDGRPDGVEFILGTSTMDKDNDVLGDDRQFIRQIIYDGFNQVLSNKQLDHQQQKLQQAGSRAQWLLELIPADASQNWLSQNLLKLSQPDVINPDLGSIQQMLQSNEFQSRFY